MCEEENYISKTSLISEPITYSNHYQSKSNNVTAEAVEVYEELKASH
jgi:hypothetical protein